jgi:hypothetical protein
MNGGAKNYAEIIQDVPLELEGIQCGSTYFGPGEFFREGKHSDELLSTLDLPECKRRSGYPAWYSSGFSRRTP